MLHEQYTFRWTSIESEILKSRRQLFMNKQFADVTLVSDDLVKFPAHRTVLGSASKLFNSLLELTTEQAPVLFLKDVPSVQLEAMLQFIYTGEASVTADELVRLSEVAIDLQIYAFLGSSTETGQNTSYNPLLDRKPFEVGFQSEELKSVNGDEDSVPLANYFSTVSSHALNNEIGYNDSMNKILQEDMKFDDSPSKENKDMVPEKSSENKIRIRKVEEPSECPICAKVFTTQRSLQRHHQSIHELRQWNCEECGKNFSQSSSLKEHVRTIHLKMQARQKEVKNECKICCEIFLYTNTKRHMSKHGIKEPQIDVHYTNSRRRYIRLGGDRSSAAPSIDPVGLSSDVYNNM